MKKLLSLTLFLFLANTLFAQDNGITYQAVIYSPDAIELPGQDNMLAPLTNQEVCMRFSFLDDGLASEYQETISIVTDDFGMVNLIMIGNINYKMGIYIVASSILTFLIFLS